jgi:hypothetical protein
LVTTGETLSSFVTSPLRILPHFLTQVRFLKAIPDATLLEVPIPLDTITL